MASYIYMKILESQPDRYDRGISWMSFGQAPRVKQKIADELIDSGMCVFEIGSGTGTLAVMAAEKGAIVDGIDVSPGMLSVAKKKISEKNLEDKIKLQEMGVSGLDSFKDDAYDLVMSTLVFSELSDDEKNYSLKHAFRLLKTGGKIVIADEVKPQSFLQNIIHKTLRAPLLVITFLITQTSTSAVTGLEEKMVKAGFAVEVSKTSTMGSFIYLVGKKE